VGGGVGGDEEEGSKGERKPQMISEHPVASPADPGNGRESTTEKTFAPGSASSLVSGRLRDALPLHGPAFAPPRLSCVRL
jgi:hypothetical protein